ncbi:TRAP transporter small permease [Lutimaribacter marinistellae]|uniref:TRAP transporter small permease protein n=1 Tax=Lutimaribacter marinistellae TaxID=1820329 RepID=A0ABV7TPK7_9RHOB
MTSLNSAFDRVLLACAIFAAGIFGATAVLISVNVVLRNLGAATIYGLLDAVEYGLLAATFLAAPWVLSQKAHVSVDLVTSVLRPATSRRLSRAVSLTGFTVSLVFLRYAVEAAWRSAERGSMIRTAFTIPEWWVLAIAPVAFVLICIEFLRQAAHPDERAEKASGL